MLRPLFVVPVVVSVTACLATIACSSGSSPWPVDIAPAGHAGDPSLPMGGAGRGSGSGAAEASGGEASGGGTVSSGGGASAPTVDGNAAVVCDTAAECDDGLTCNGAEQCVANACAAGAPIECSPPLSCSEDAGGACVFADDSPWVVYGADDEVPARIDLYAVKQGLIGKMEPVRLNEPLEVGATLVQRMWSPNGQWYWYLVRPSVGVGTGELIYFGAGMPRRVARLRSSDLAWSPSSAMFSVKDETGVHVYETRSTGEVERAFDVMCGQDCRSADGWSVRDQLLLTMMPNGSDSWQIYLVSRDETTWSSSLLLDGRFKTYDLSPPGTELTYEVEETEGEPPALYAIAVSPGSKPRLVGPSGTRNAVSWNEDGSQFLLTHEDAAGNFQASLGMGSVYSAKSRSVLPSYRLTSASFAPDGRQLLVREPAGDGYSDVGLLDPSSDLSTPRSMFRTVDLDPMRYAWGGDVIVAVSRDDLSDPAELMALPLPQPRPVVFDIIPVVEKYQFLSLSRKSEFFLYSKGEEATQQGFYVDLRYNESWGYRPVRVPGAGRFVGGHFNRAGTALYYLREHMDGARECLYLDLSKQVAAEPVKLSRSGRVEHCQEQR